MRGLRFTNMLSTISDYLHLIATGLAIATIVVADTRLTIKLLASGGVVPPPNRLETVLVTAALLALCATGAVLIASGLSAKPGYLDNAKLKAKLLLVSVLALNAWVLHFRVFPILRLSQPVSTWSRVQWVTVTGSASLSTSMWLYCAFLGLTKSWNFSVSVWFVLAVGLTLWAAAFSAVNAVLLLASRRAFPP